MVAPIRSQLVSKLVVAVGVGVGVKVGGGMVGVGVAGCVPVIVGDGIGV